MNPKKIFDFIAKKNPKYELENILNNQPRLIQYNSHLIQFIDNPSEEIQLKIIDVNPSLIQYINNPSEEVQLKEIFEDLRSEILDRGNNQIRNLESEFANYEIIWKKYSMKLPFVDKGD